MKYRLFALAFRAAALLHRGPERAALVALASELAALERPSAPVGAG